MTSDIILASNSESRKRMLAAAGVDFIAHPARLDEDSIMASMAQEGASPRDIADALAEAKAQKLSLRHVESYVIGSDQTLAFEGGCVLKPETEEQLREQLQTLRGKTHVLNSAAVISLGGRVLWRHVGVARMTMRDFSDSYLDDYIRRNWDEVRHSVGGYHVEAEGARLFARIQGDTFTVQGLPLIEVLGCLTMHGALAT